jgi:predicted dithiol-disulfide oxidoreductase (DUF899 family)
MPRCRSLKSIRNKNKGEYDVEDQNRPRNRNRKVVSQREWLAARKKLLAKEKKFSKLRDELNLQRRKLPWVKIEKGYVFDGPTGKVTLGDLFCRKSQLTIYHFMFGPGWKEGCLNCSFWADHFDSATRLSRSFSTRR